MNAESLLAEMEMAWENETDVGIAVGIRRCICLTKKHESEQPQYEEIAGFDDVTVEQHAQDLVARVAPTRPVVTIREMPVNAELLKFAQKIYFRCMGARGMFAGNCPQWLVTMSGVVDDHYPLDELKKVIDAAEAASKREIVSPNVYSYMDSIDAIVKGDEFLQPIVDALPGTKDEKFGQYEIMDYEEKGDLSGRILWDRATPIAGFICVRSLSNTSRVLLWRSNANEIEDKTS